MRWSEGNASSSSIELGGSDGGWPGKLGGIYRTRPSVFLKVVRRCLRKGLNHFAENIAVCPALHPSTRRPIHVQNNVDVAGGVGHSESQRVPGSALRRETGRRTTRASRRGHHEPGTRPRFMPIASCAALRL